MLKMTPERAVEFTKLFVILVSSWPPWPDASKFKKILFNVFSWILLISLLLLIVLLCYAAIYQLDDYLLLTTTMCQAGLLVHAFTKIVICKEQRPELEVLHKDIKDFLSNATITERELLQRYVDRFGFVYLTYNICCVIAALSVIISPLVLPQKFPTNAKYPFSVDDHPIREIAYLHQSLVCLQCGEIGAIDCQAALLIWFAGARLELLANEFRSVTSLRELNNCIRKHQFLLGKMTLIRYRKTEDMVHAVRYIILTSTVMTTLSIVTSGIVLVSEEPMEVKVQFLTILITCISVLFLSAWPAENLIYACTQVGQGAYDSPWIHNSPEARKNILFVMQRSQRYSNISVAGVLPALSLTYYSAFLSKTFSFFTTIRIIFDDGSNES